ncbi:hypothetical protein Tco_1058256 [Tanacetum coccineum]|uniref:Uncharacterized protein n=1 Tax=Tanacetum coccineum TaxID=301880 RepID=A0ABQ5H8G2_9ASTR
MDSKSSSQSQQPKQLTPALNVHFEVKDGTINFNNGIALLESKNTTYHPMLQFLSKCCISVSLTKQPSTYYSKYLREFWYTAEADTTTKTITFTLSNFDKPLSFDLDVFSTVIWLKRSENLVSVPPKETVSVGLATLGLIDENDTSISSSYLVNSSPLKMRYFSPKWRVLMQYIVKCLGGMQGSHDQLNLHPVTGKHERKSNICYTRYLSLIIEHLLGDAYINENLKNLKPHHITALSFKPTLENEVPLTAHLCKVANLSPEPIKSLLQPSRDVIADDIANKSSSETSVQHVTRPKAKTDKKLRRKKIPASSDSKASKIVRESTLTLQVADTQHVEETVATTDTTQSLKASELAEEQRNQPETTNTIKKVDHVVEEEDHDNGIDSSIMSIGDVRLEDFSINDEDSPFDTKSEIKVLVEELANSDLHSMSDDESEKATADNILDEMAALKAFVDKPSDPLGRLWAKISSLSNKVDNLESSLAKKVSSKLEESVPRMVAAAFKEQMPKLISDTLKNILPNIIEESFQQALPKFEEDSGDPAELVNLMKDMVHLLNSTLVFCKANAEGEKWEKANPDPDITESNLQGEQKLNDDKMANVQKGQLSVLETSSRQAPPISEQVPPLSTSLVVHASEEKSLEEKVSEEESFSKRLKIPGKKMTLEVAQAQLIEIKRLVDLKAEQEKTEQKLKALSNKELEA